MEIAAQNVNNPNAKDMKIHVQQNAPNRMQQNMQPNVLPLRMLPVQLLQQQQQLQLQQQQQQQVAIYKKKLNMGGR